MAYRSILGTLRRSVQSFLKKDGVNVGGTAAYPRIEIHPTTENAPLDKDGSIKSCSYTIECVSQQKYADCLALQADNLERLFTESLTVDPAKLEIIGIQAGQVRELEETDDTTNVLYRILQDVTIFVKTK